MSEQTGAVAAQDTEQIAHQLATQALVAEEKNRQAMRSRVHARAKAKKDAETGKIRMEDGQLVEPCAAFLQSASVDFSHIPDECLKSDKHGAFKVRWVNKLDAWGEPSETDIGYHQRFGFEVIKDKNGKTFERREFIAMQGPQAGFAALLAKNAKPGSDVYDRAFKGFEDLVDQTNRRAGYRAVEEWTAPDHGQEPAHRVSFDK